MADPMVALATGLAAVLLFLLLIGLTAYLLWKKRQDQRRDTQLISTNPVIPPCTPVFQTSQGSSYGLAEVPFFLPPSFKSSSHSAVPEGREEEEQWEQHPHLHTQRGSLTIGSWFPLGSLRPDLYQLPEEPSEWAQPSGSTVRLCFAVQYQHEQEQLVVSLLQAANLPAQCQSNATLVKLQLLPSEDRHLRQAKARSKGIQPQFNDTFVFQVSNNNVDQFTLRMSLYSVDRLKKHHLVGHVLFPLRHSELREAAGKVLWRDLETESDLPLSKHGNIQVSLNYSQSLQRLTVVVLRAQGLQCPSNADVSVQVSLQIHTQVVKTKRTPVTRGSNPTFNEKLTFRLLPLQLDAACLSLEVQQLPPEEPAEVPSTRTKVPISLGLVVIGPFMYARGRELEHWNEMISKSQELVKQWHGLGAANNTHRST
ncbi:synaptotagmin-15 isoform X1 [Ictalurus punctatus]|uniref:Synaptotagmin-15 isoform X1 n=1 Tax=Ictalurus punctatus TaxID=7998 RepID=A0A2D0S6R3_ICTPU|nr:synaptotagmin-15 isoform X1 [Ictalurus punctatus]